MRPSNSLWFKTYNQIKWRHELIRRWTFCETRRCFPIFGGLGCSKGISSSVGEHTVKLEAVFSYLWVRVSSCLQQFELFLLVSYSLKLSSLDDTQKNILCEVLLMFSFFAEFRGLNHSAMQKHCYPPFWVPGTWNAMVSTLCIETNYVVPGNWFFRLTINRTLQIFLAS
jgi:hypothetical protein